MATTKESCSVGVLGLGKMGSAIAERLMACGHTVAIWNRTSSKGISLKGLGASVASSPAEVAESADLVIVNVTDHEATVAVLETEGMAAALRGKTLVQTAMTTSAEVEALAAWAAANGTGFLGAFILTYPVSVRQGAGKIVYSGPKRLFDAHIGAFTAFDTEPKFLASDVGAAATFGAAVISSFFGCAMSYFHGAAMSERCGISIDLYTEYAADDAFESMKDFGQMLRDRSDDKPVAATLPIYAAALDVVLREAEAHGVENAFHAPLATHLAKGIADGHGERDIDSIWPQFFKGTT